MGIFKKIKIIISSHLSEKENDEIKENINQTIGKVPRETIIYRNFNKYSLPQIYNMALNEHHKSNDEIFIFMHNDILFKTKKWGEILLNYFNNYDYQIIGIAGSKIMPQNGVWWHDKSKLLGCVEHTDGINTWLSEFSKPFSGLKPCVVVDGLFFALNPNELIHKFNESFGMFHFYELPMMVDNYLDGLNIAVTTEIRVLHKSIGLVNEEWELNRMKFIKYFEEELPIKLS